MKNLPSNQLSNDNLLTINNEKRKKGKLFIKNLNHKNTAPYVSSKILNIKKSIFAKYNKSIINKINTSENIRINECTNNNSKRGSSLNQNKYNYVNTENLLTFYKNNQNNNNIYTLPNINSFQNIFKNEIISKFKNSSIEKKDNNKLERKIKINKINNENPKSKLSTENIKRFYNLINFEKDSKQLPAKKFLKKETYINIHKKFDLLGNLDILKNENGDKSLEKVKNEVKNHKLLYSKKHNDYIFQVYKTVDNNKKLDAKKRIFNYLFKNKKKTLKYSIQDNFIFDPKKYVKEIKNKIESEDIGNPTISKKKLLDKTFDYIDYIICEKNKLNKKKYDILEKIKEKNMHLIIKNRKEILQNAKNEIILNNYKHKKTIFKFHIDNLLISQCINYHIFIKINIIRHVLTTSENVYFINLINHLFYSGKKKISIKYPFIKSYGEIVSNYIKKNLSIEKYLELHSNKLYYLYLFIKFQLIDCETIISPNLKKIYSHSKQEINALNESTNKEYMCETSLEKSSSSKNKKNKKDKVPNKINKKNNIKSIAPLALNTINLSKSIINLRNINKGQTFKNKILLNLGKIKQLTNLKKLCEEKHKEIKENSDSSDILEIKKSDSINNNNINNNNDLNNIVSMKDDNKEVHERDKKIIFEHFFSCAESYQYDKLLSWLEKCSKYMDLNHTLNNGDNLLHLSVNYSVPHYIIKFLVTHGININSQNNDGDTALHLAVKNHKYKTIDLLINMGASEYIYNKMHKKCWECF